MAPSRCLTCEWRLPSVVPQSEPSGELAAQTDPGSDSASPELTATEAQLAFRVVFQGSSCACQVCIRASPLLQGRKIEINVLNFLIAANGIELRLRWYAAGVWLLASAPQLAEADVAWRAPPPDQSPGAQLALRLPGESFQRCRGQ